MRFTNLAFPFKRLDRLLTSTSVRNRIFVLALIPVIGFLANGPTYVSGKREVGTAFETVMHSTALADATRDSKSVVAAMQMVVKDFAANPSNNLVLNFGREHAQALRSLDIIAASIDRRRHRTGDRTGQSHHS
jgi:methyl-accepting chemotaxis protein